MTLARENHAILLWADLFIWWCNDDDQSSLREEILLEKMFLVSSNLFLKEAIKSAESASYIYKKNRSITACGIYYFSGSQHEKKNTFLLSSGMMRQFNPCIHFEMEKRRRENMVAHCVWWTMMEHKVSRVRSHTCLYSQLPGSSSSSSSLQ